MIDARQALERLGAGNRRYVARVPSACPCLSDAQRAETLHGQHPIATVLGCSDSRVPAELIFDQGVGDLFVIRVAGNIVTPAVLGSAEYAATVLGVPLIVVLGHSRCGAVNVTVDNLRQPGGEPSPNLQALIEGVRPAAEQAIAEGGGGDGEALLSRAIRANVRRAVHELQERSETLKTLAENGGLMIVGAEYSLETGEVEFLEGLA